jgi:hypothetical protein
LVEHARTSGADKEVLENLKKMPDRNFDGPNAVSQAYSQQS